MRELVVNADDFGMSPGVNRGIIRAHTEGIVTSASLMVRRGFAPDAVALASGHPALGLGLHLDLSEWERRDDGWVAVYVVVDHEDEPAVRAELDRQLARFRDLTGRDPTHLDSHHHVHQAEPVRTLARAAAARLGIPLRHDGGVRYLGDFYGQDGRGERIRGALEPAALVRAIDKTSERVTELACHPAETVDFRSTYAIERLLELRALCDPAVKAAIAERGIRLRRFAASDARSRFGGALPGMLDR